MIRKFGFLFAAVAATSLTALAQGSAPSSTTTMGVAPSNPISMSQSQVYKMLSGNLVAAALKMPEENYSFQPTPDVRTFGQLVGHLADAQFFFCSTAAGDKPKGGFEKKTSKADLVAGLKDAVAYCTTVNESMTDAKGSEMVKMMGFNVAKLAVLSTNTAHDYEHYGNMVTYMRLKGLVPPSSEKSSSSATK